MKVALRSQRDVRGQHYWKWVRQGWLSRTGDPEEACNRVEDLAGVSSHCMGGAGC